MTVLEARSIGAVTTGNTTAKISLLQGTRLSDILAHHSADVADAYLQANDEGKAWLERYCGEHGVDVQIRDAFSYASTGRGLPAVEREYEAGRRSGPDVELVEALAVSFPHVGAVQLSDQAQFNPMKALRTLASDLLKHGGRIHEGVRALDVDAGKPCRIRTTISADNVILATGTPFLDRGLYFAKLEPERSYAPAFSVPGLEPTDMYLSVDAPTRSVRSAPTAEGEVLLIGGNGHPVGLSKSPREHAEDLDAWAKVHYPGAAATHSWSAQDDHIPFVGKLPRGRGRVYLATGYGKWRRTNAVAAAIRISTEILDGNLSSAKPIAHRVTRPRVAARGAWTNIEVGAELAKRWFGTGFDNTRSEGEGTTGRIGLKPVAVSTVDGATCRLSAVCTHLVESSAGMMTKRLGIALSTAPVSTQTEPCSKARQPRR